MPERENGGSDAREGAESQSLTPLFTQRLYEAVEAKLRSYDDTGNAEVLCDLVGLFGPVVFSVEWFRRGVERLWSRAQGYSGRKPRPDMSATDADLSVSARDRRVAREALKRIAHALVPPGRRGQPSKPSPAIPNLLALYDALTIVITGVQQDYRRVPIQDSEPFRAALEKYVRGVVIATRKGGGRPIDVLKDEPRDIAIAVIAETYNCSPKQVTRQLRGHRRGDAVREFSTISAPQDGASDRL